jgi:hypothetical protein
MHSQSLVSCALGKLLLDTPACRCLAIQSCRNLSIRRTLAEQSGVTNTADDSASGAGWRVGNPGPRGADVMALMMQRVHT